MTAPDTDPTATPAPGTDEAPAPATFRVPRASLVALLFLAMSLSPIAFQGGWWFALFLIPIAIAWWILRTRTVVDTDGLRVRTAWSSTRWTWERVTTLRVADRGWVRAVGPESTELVLRGVRVRDLGRIGEASGGRIRVPGEAEAQAAEEHRLELEAARMRVARLRELRPDLTEDEAREVEAAGSAEAPASGEALASAEGPGSAEAGEDTDGDRGSRA